MRMLHILRYQGSHNHLVVAIVFILLHTLTLHLCVAVDDTCQLGEGEVVRLCPVCTERQAGVRWTASGTDPRVNELRIYFKCTNNSGNEVSMDSDYDRNLELDGWLLTRVSVADEFFKRVSVIDNDFSDGDTCVFKASALPDKPNIPEVSCTINGSLDHSCNPESCRLPATCDNDGWDWQCNCTTGFQGNSCDGYIDCLGGIMCEDVDECQLPEYNSTCDANADCVNTIGSYYCQCRVGYTGNGTDCSDVDECQLPEYNSTCDINADCVNTDGSYYCQCRVGYTGNGANCSGEGEVVRLCPVCTERQAGVRWTANTIGTDPHPHVRELRIYFKCTNKSGNEVSMDSYYDRNLVLDGWLLTEVAVVRNFFKRVSVIDNDFSDGDTCVFKASTLPDKLNIPEVSCTINGSLDPSKFKQEKKVNGFCSRIVPSSTGLMARRSSGRSEELDSCNQESCRLPATCDNDGWNWQCHCTTGFQGNSCDGYWYCLEGIVCEDKDECQLPEYNSTCDANADCVNTIGSCYCQCRAGYTGNGTDCSDVDECQLPEYNSACDINADCVNTDGSYYCQCRDGYTGNGVNCSDVDCGTRLDNITNGDVMYNGTSYNSVATYSCDPGYGLQGRETRTCQNNGTWSGGTPSCQIVDCGGLQDIHYGGVSSNGTTYNSVANYSCGPGYELQGEEIRTCLNSGNWSGDTPLCQKLDATEGTSQPNVFLITGSSLATMFLVTVLIGVGILIYYTKRRRERLKLFVSEPTPSFVKHRLRVLRESLDQGPENHRTLWPQHNQLTFPFYTSSDTHSNERPASQPHCIPAGERPPFSHPPKKVV